MSSQKPINKVNIFMILALVIGLLLSLVFLLLCHIDLQIAEYELEAYKQLVKYTSISDSERISTPIISNALNTDENESVLALYNECREMIKKVYGDDALTDFHVNDEIVINREPGYGVLPYVRVREIETNKKYPYMNVSIDYTFNADGHCSKTVSIGKKIWGKGIACRFSISDDQLFTLQTQNY